MPLGFVEGFIYSKTQVLIMETHTLPLLMTGFRWEFESISRETQPQTNLFVVGSQA